MQQDNRIQLFENKRIRTAWMPKRKNGSFPSSMWWLY